MMSEITLHNSQESGSARCDLCDSEQLSLLYHPRETARGLAVYQCQCCNLLQSLPRIDHVHKRQVRLSSEADWGNIRYGKGFRSESAIKNIGKALGLSTLRTCLDVGSNRGAFVRALREKAPSAHILAIEPDGEITDEYQDLPNVETVIERIEHLTLPQNHFELVHCSHTLEHLANPKQTLHKLFESLTTDGVIFLEVPNLQGIGRKDMIEEWFIDKHLYHFSHETLLAYVKTIGVDGSAVSFQSSPDYLTVVIKKDLPLSYQPVLEKASQKTLDATVELVRRYEKTLQTNRQTIKAAAEFIVAQADTHRILLWGAGRIFDCLVRFGGLDVKKIVGLVDKHLVNYVEERHGLRLFKPAELLALKPDLVLIASRAFEDEIRAELAKLLPQCRALSFSELLYRASS